MRKSTQCKVWKWFCLKIFLIYLLHKISQIICCKNVPSLVKLQACAKSSLKQSRKIIHASCDCDIATSLFSSCFNLSFLHATVFYFYYHLPSFNLAFQYVISYTFVFYHIDHHWPGLFRELNRCLYKCAPLLPTI